MASENPDEAGRYSMDVEYGQYSVILLVEGFPPSHAGTITVYEDSRPGTLNDFLGAMTEDDAVRGTAPFELMVEEVARNASAVAQNTAAAKKSASDAAHQPVRRQPMRLMLQAQPAPARQPDRPRVGSVSSSSAGTASTKATEASKSAAAAESSKSAAATSAGAAKTSETNAQRHKNLQPLLHPPRPRKRQKLPPQPGMRRPQKRQRNHQKRTHHQAPVVPLPRQRRQEIPRRRQKRPRRTPGLLKRQRDRAPQLRQAQKQRLRRLPVPRQQVPGRPQPVPPPPENRQKVPHRLLQQPQRRLAKPLNRPAQQRGLLPQRRHPNERESVGNQRRILKNGCRIVRQFGGVIGIIGVCFKR
ncbi:prophage tail fiber family protein [Escherichia coli p0305293.4]|nr:prophage tail fiber family protein [Escherichia coli p0305293.4]